MHPAEEPEPHDPGGRNFLDLAKRLVAVPKHEIDRLRKEQGEHKDNPQST
jgi:hypothetical protein